MFSYFFQFHKKPMAFELFSKDTEDGTPSPPTSEELLSNDLIILIGNDGQELLSNDS